MEGAPQFEKAGGNNQEGFDREVVAMEAAQTAKQMIAEKIDDSLQPEEREQALQDLMEELAEDNGNRFIVEAIAQQRSRETLVKELQTFDSMFPYVEAANDEENYANAA